MASAWITVIVLTGFWGVIGIIIPWFIPKGPNRGIIQTMLVMTAVCCYVLWLCTFLMQLNPLIGPELETKVIRAIKMEWEGTA